MPKTPKTQQEGTVRMLVTSVTELARHLELTPNTIYRWIKVNRIPGKYLLRVAAFYDIPVPMHLAQSDIKNGAKIRHKPRETLPTCLEVQAGNLTIEEAAKKLGIHERAVQLIITNWGDQLKTLYKTLVQLDKDEISLDQAAATLKVTKFNIHALRKKYGFRPKPRAKAKERPIVARRKTATQVALDCIAGKINLAEVEDNCNLSWRTIHRMIGKLSPGYSLIELTHWPKTFRQAYSDEIAQNAPKISEKLWKYAQISQIYLKKWPKYPPSPKDWRLANVRKMMIHVLLGDESVESIAEKRGADPYILETLFTGDLRMLGLTWPEVRSTPLMTQVALAELLLALEESKRTPRQRMIERLEEEKAVD